MKGRLLPALMLPVFLVAGFNFPSNGAVAAPDASLFLAPAVGNFVTGQSFSVAVRLNSTGDINAAEGLISFPSNLLTVTGISRAGSIFNLWVREPEVSDANTISFVGGLPGGYSGLGTIFNINFRAVNVGVATINFASGAKILANDGYGTNVLTSTRGGTYTIQAAVAPTPTPEPTPAAVQPRAPVITSSTHPDPNSWYSNNNPAFKWDVPSGVTEVILVLSRNASSIPFVRYSPPISERILEDLGEGTWYLNARFRMAAGLGPVASFRFNIDTQPPRPFDITRLDTDDPTNPRPELSFESSDGTSGINYYELIVNGGEPVRIAASEAGRIYAMPLQTPGEKDIEIKAVDRAGNSTSARLTILVESIEIPHLDRVTAKAREGAPITVEGTAKSNQKVSIHFVEDSRTYETIADENGRFTMTITDLPVGKYKIYARAQDERGAISDPSKEMPIEVREGIIDLIFRIFDWLVNLLSGKGLFIAFLLALVGLILALIELLKVHAGKNIKKFLNWMLVKMARRKSIQKVEHIIKDMENELEYLKRIEKRRSLNTEEKYLKGRISEYLKMLKQIDKEIHNKD